MEQAFVMFIQSCIEYIYLLCKRGARKIAEDRLAAIHIRLVGISSYLMTV